MGTFRVVQAGLEPLVNFIRYLPVTSFVPLFILWIGIGIEQRIAVIFFGTFFQQLVMIADVSRGVSKDLLNASYTLGASRRDALLHVLTPAALPGIIDTLRITMGWAWTYLVVAELVAASSRPRLYQHEGDARLPGRRDLPRHRGHRPARPVHRPDLPGDPHENGRLGAVTRRRRACRATGPSSR